MTERAQLQHYNPPPPLLWTLSDTRRGHRGGGDDPFRSVGRPLVCRPVKTTLFPRGRSNLWNPAGIADFCLTRDLQTTYCSGLGGRGGRGGSPQVSPQTSVGLSCIVVLSPLWILNRSTLDVCVVRRGRSWALLHTSCFVWFLF